MSTVGRTSHQKAIVAELLEALAIPNVAADKPNIRRNAEHLRAMLGRHGFAPEILETTGNPLVYGALNVPGATRTVLFYCHYDGQPVDRAKWNQADPFEPVVRGEGPDARIYARSASDDKAPIVALMAAVDALKAQGLDALVQHPRHPRRRGGGQLAEPGAGDRALQGQAARGPDGDPRRSGPLERPADGRLRRARDRDGGPHRLRAEERRSQRQLRQLDAESRRCGWPRCWRR